MSLLYDDFDLDFKDHLQAGGALKSLLKQVKQEGALVDLADYPKLTPGLKEGPELDAENKDWQTFYVKSWSTL